MRSANPVPLHQYQPRVSSSSDIIFHHQSPPPPYRKPAIPKECGLQSRSESVPTFSIQLHDKRFQTQLPPTPEPKPIPPAKPLAEPKKPKSSPKKSQSSSSFLQKMGQKLSIDWHGSFQVVMLGLDNAGKSTTLYRLKMDHFIQAPPTIGFNCEKFKPSEGKAKGCLFTVWDVGGQEKLRPLWRSYVRHTDAIVFVVDSTDAERFEEAKLELSNLMRCPDIPSSVPILLVANKQDLPSAASEAEVVSAVGVGELGPVHSHRVLSCCAVTGEGLDGVFFDALHQLILTSRKLDKGRKKSTAK